MALSFAIKNIRPFSFIDMISMEIKSHTVGLELVHQNEKVKIF